MMLRHARSFLAAALLAAPPAAVAVTDCAFDLDADAQVMTLVADCTTTLEQFAVPDGWTLDGQGHVIVATGPLFKGAVVRNGGTTAHVTNLVVRGSALPCACHAGNDRLRGILFDGAGGSITGNTVENLNQGVCGCQEGNGIEVRNLSGGPAVEVAILDNVVDAYQKNGITANGDVRARIADNQAFGLAEIPFIAQNGIQVGFGASGRVERNLVDGNWYTGANWGASGILIFEANDTFVHRNVVRENQLGVTVESWGWIAPTASGNSIVNNDILESEWGIVIDALAFGGVSTTDATTARNRASGNVIGNVDVAGVAGVYVGAYSIGVPTTTATTTDTKIHGNAIAGFTDAIVDDGSDGLRPSGNNRPFKP